MAAPLSRDTVTIIIYCYRLPSSGRRLADCLWLIKRYNDPEVKVGRESLIVGTGIDIAEIARFERFVAENNLALLQRLFTPGETAYCRARRLAAQHFALRFAAKEAFLKALGTGLRDGINWLDIEVVNDELGKPLLELSGKAAEYFVAAGGVKCHLSMSHDAGCAVAMVVLEGK
jgi:holo-[acyl-carrier protein] synthase